MSQAKVRVFNDFAAEQKAAGIEVAPDAGNSFYIRVTHPHGGSRLISVLLGPKGGIDITRGAKLQ